MTPIDTSDTPHIADEPDQAANRCAEDRLDSIGDVPEGSSPVETTAVASGSPDLSNVDGETKPAPWAKLVEHPVAVWLAHWVPLGGFVGGFVFDELTLGRQIQLIDFILLSAYALVATAALIINSRRWFERGRDVLTFVCQFALGALFSALVVLYFKSAGGVLPTLFVLGLFGAMVANEFLHKRDNLKTVVWAIYAISIVMWLNFLLPHVLKSVQPAWFYVSSGTGLGLVVGAHRLAGLSRRSLAAPVAGVGLLIGLYVFGLVPPVPLVLESGIVCTDFVKSGKSYECQADPQGSIAEFLGMTPTVTRQDKDAVYVLSSVSAPGEANVDLEHRWYQYVDGSWKARDVMHFTMTGGRKDGWRFWSRKRNISVGRWRVETALKGGGVVSRQELEVVDGTATKVLRRL